MRKLFPLLALLVALLGAPPAWALDNVRTNFESLGGVDAALTIGSRDYGSVIFQLSGTFSATVTFEASTDETNWIEVPAANVASGSKASTTDTTGIYLVNCVGTFKVRARVSAFTSGPVVAIGVATEGVGSLVTSSGGGGGAEGTVDLTGINGVTPSTGNGTAGSGTLRVAIASNNTAFGVTDAGGSFTVDAPVGTPVFVRLSDGSSAISTLPVSLASVPSHAVTNAGTFAVQVDGAALTALQAIDNPIGNTGSAVPAQAQYTGVNSDGNLTGLIQADASVKIDVSTATTTQLVALASSQRIYITSWDVIAAGTGTIKLVYGTGSNCGTGTTDLTGAYSLVAQAGLAKGNGLGPVLVVPASNALCVTTSAAVGMQGSVSYTQF